MLFQPTWCGWLTIVWLKVWAFFIYHYACSTEISTKFSRIYRRHIFSLLQVICSWRHWAYSSRHHYAYSDVSHIGREQITMYVVITIPRLQSVYTNMLIQCNTIYTINGSESTKFMPIWSLMTDLFIEVKSLYNKDFITQFNYYRCNVSRSM